MLEVEQVAVARHDVVRFGSERARDHHVVVGIAHHRGNVDEVGRDFGEERETGDERGHVLIAVGEALAEMLFGEQNVFGLSKDRRREVQREDAISSKMEELIGGSSGSCGQEGADQNGGVDDRVRHVCDGVAGATLQLLPRSTLLVRARTCACRAFGPSRAR